MIKKFAKGGVKCAINIDPIMPFITDSKYNLEKILNYAVANSVGYVSSGILRLRADIWKRVQVILHTLHKEDVIKQYVHIYNINDFTITKNSLLVENEYSYKILDLVKNECRKRSLQYKFPNLIYKTNHDLSNENSRAVTLLDYIK